MRELGLAGLRDYRTRHVAAVEQQCLASGISSAHPAHDGWPGQHAATNPVLIIAAYGPSVMDKPSASKYKAAMTGVGALAITAGATLLGVLIPTLATLWLTRESNTQTRLYRNHDKRISIAEEYLRALGTFRRTIRDYADARGAKADETYRAMIAAARNAADAGEFLRLYFDEGVREAAERVGNFLWKMQERAEEMVRNSDNDHAELEQWDESGKQARDLLISSMKSQLGELGAQRKHRLWIRPATGS